MERNFDRLKQGPFDLLVIGGGIYGAWTAYDAALRGLKVALVEKGDWASGTSSASSKLIHGGLRYLQQYNFSLVRRSLAERALLLRLAPHRILPSRFYIPLYKSNWVGSLRLRAGLTLYDILSRKDSPGGRRLTIGAEQFSADCPFLEREGLLGALSYGDCITDDGRFTLEIVEGAARAGAVAVNYARAGEVLIHSGRAFGAAVQDELDNNLVEVEARTVVNTAGPWVGSIPGGEPMSGRVRLTKGIHLVFSALPLREAFLFLTPRDGRVFFCVPWYGRTLVGTTDTDYSGNPDDAVADPEDKNYLLHEVSRVLPGEGFSQDAVLGTSAGMRALIHKPGKNPSSLSRQWILMEPKEGLLVSVGGKYTTARVDAALIVDRVLNKLGRPGNGKPPTESRPFPFRPEGEFTSWEKETTSEGVRLGLDAEAGALIPRRYGTAAADIHRLLRRRPELSGRLVPDLAFCKAEVIQAAGEMAVHLADIMRRRIPVMLLSRPDRKVLEEAASLAAPVLGWSNDRSEEEVEAAFTIWESTS